MRVWGMNQARLDADVIRLHDEIFLALSRKLPSRMGEKRRCIY